MHRDRTPFLFSPDGDLLTLSSNLSPQPVLTVEISSKWYSLFLIHGDRSIEQIDFGYLSEIWDDHPDRPRFGSAYVDHCPNPHAVELLADQKDWWLDDLAYELIWGRWATEVLDYVRQPPTMNR